MKKAVVALAMLLSLLSISLAQAQVGFPSRPIRIVVPVVPGSFTDLAARAPDPGRPGVHHFKRGIHAAPRRRDADLKNLVARRGIKVE